MHDLFLMVSVPFLVDLLRHVAFRIALIASIGSVVRDCDIGIAEHGEVIPKI